MNFPLAVGAYEYRPLKTGMKGWDCYGVQTCLIGAGYPLPSFGADGFFGSETHSAVSRFQQAAGLVKDGIAGVMTQRVLVLANIKVVATLYRLPVMLEESHVEAESSFWAGNYTAPYDRPGQATDRSRDLSLIMRNQPETEWTKESVLRSLFNGPAAVEYLAGSKERGLRSRKDRYYGRPGAKSHKRAWQLAVGSWNAPSVADSVAAGTRPAPDWFEAYIERATAYVLDWTP